MSTCKFPLRYALLVAALAQLQVADVYAAKADKDKEDAKACEDCPDYSGRSGWVEAGIGIQSDDSYHFGRYTGFQESGALINLNGEVTYRGGLDGAYLNGKAVDIGLESRRLSVEGGRQGKYAVAVEYDQIPNYRKNLTNASLETERDRTGVKFSMVPSQGWEVTGRYRHETKDGTRDLGAGFGYTDAQVLAVPVRYQTDDFGVELGYQSEKLQVRLGYAGSLFDNDKTAFSWPNPSPGPATGQVAESPDNQFHQISAQLGYQLSERTRIGASLARGRMTQNESFLGYTSNAAIVTPALPSSSLDGQVDTTLAKLELNARPDPKLRLDASYTYSNRDNNTPVNTYSYVVADSFLSPALRQNRPYSFEQQLLRLKAGYRLPKGADLSGGFDIDKMDRTYQQATQTEDHTLWAKLKLKPWEGVDTTFKASHATRDASAYDPTAFANPVSPESGAIPGDPLMKAFEMADRTRDKIGVDVSLTSLEKLSLGFNLDYYKDDYKKMVLGLTQASGLTVTPNLTYAFDEDLSVSAYYTYERLKSSQSGREWITPPLVPDVLWAESDNNTTQTVGLSANWKAIPKKLDIGADLVYSDFTGKIHYPGSTDLPDLSSTLTAIGVHGVYKLKENMTIRADYRYEKFSNADWANVGLPLNPLGLAPGTEETNLVYVSIRYAFK